MYTVSRNYVIDSRRAQVTRPKEVFVEIDKQTGDPTEKVTTKMVIYEALSALKDNHRAVVEACYLRELSTAEAAVALGIPHGTVKSRLNYALRELRTALAEKGITSF